MKKRNEFISEGDATTTKEVRKRLNGKRKEISFTSSRVALMSYKFAKKLFPAPRRDNANRR